MTVRQPPSALIQPLSECHLPLRDGRRAIVPGVPDLAKLDLIGHAALVRAREATPLELLDAAITRIDAARR